MNTKTVVISSITSSPVTYLNSITLVDMTNLSFNLSNIAASRCPIVVEFNWYGDGSASDTYTASANTGWGTLSTLFTSLTTKQYNYIYSPAVNTLVKSFSCIITYINANYNNNSNVNSYNATIIQPITIFASSFYSKIEDMDILQTNIIDNTVLVTLGTAANGSVVETLLTL